VAIGRRDEYMLDLVVERFKQVHAPANFSADRQRWCAKWKLN